MLASLLEICRNGIEDIEWQADRVNVKQDAEYLRYSKCSSVAIRRLMLVVLDLSMRKAI